MTAIDRTGASEQEFRARIARFEADDAERVETVARAIGQHVFGLLDSFGQPNYTARKVAAAAIAALPPSPAEEAVKRVEALADYYAESPHDHGIGDGHPGCAACWVADLRAALASPAPAPHVHGAWCHPSADGCPDRPGM